MHLWIQNGTRQPCKIDISQCTDIDSLKEVIKSKLSRIAHLDSDLVTLHSSLDSQEPLRPGMTLEQLMAEKNFPGSSDERPMIVKTAEEEPVQEPVPIVIQPQHVDEDLIDLTNIDDDPPEFTAEESDPDEHVPLAKWTPPKQAQNVVEIVRPVAPRASKSLFEPGPEFPDNGTL